MIGLIYLDDFAIAPLKPGERNDRLELLELLDDRVGARSTLLNSHLPVSAWHEWLGEITTLADAIPDRNGSHKIALKGK